MNALISYGYLLHIIPTIYREIVPELTAKGTSNLILGTGFLRINCAGFEASLHNRLW